MYTRARLLTAAAFAALIMMALGSSSFGQGCTLIPGIFSGVARYQTQTARTESQPLLFRATAALLIHRI